MFIRVVIWVYVSVVLDWGFFGELIGIDVMLDFFGDLDILSFIN